MCRAPLLLSLLAIAAGAGDARPAIREEPVYSSKSPGYAVVVFGAKQERAIWVAVDEKVVFIDRDGNGSLVGPGERVEAGLHGYFAADIAGCDESGKPGDYTLTLDVARDEAGRLGLKLLNVNAVGNVNDFHCSAGFIPLGDRPERAPGVPLHGPLRFVLMDHWTGSTACRVLPRDGGPHEFSILVATPILGIECEAYVYPNLYLLQKEEIPDVKMAFVPSDASAAVPAPALRTWFCECGRRYRTALRVPPAAGVKKATLSVSFPGWKHGELPPAAFELVYAAPAKKQ